MHSLQGNPRIPTIVGKLIKDSNNEIASLVGYGRFECLKVIDGVVLVVPSAVMFGTLSKVQKVVMIEMMASLILLKC